MLADKFYLKQLYNQSVNYQFKTRILSSLSESYYLKHLHFAFEFEITNYFLIKEKVSMQES